MAINKCVNWGRQKLIVRCTKCDGYVECDEVAEFDFKPFIIYLFKCKDCGEQEWYNTKELKELELILNDYTFISSKEGHV